MSRIYQPPRRIGRVAYLQGVSATGKAIRVSIESQIENGGRTSIWVPISQVHEDSEIYGIDEQGRRQLIGSHGSLIVTAWWTNQRDNAALLSEHGVVMKDYES